MSRVKDETWTTVAVVAASYLSSTFKSSTATTTWLQCDGVFYVKFQLSSVVLGTATKVYVCPKFKDEAGTVTYLLQQDNSTPVRWPLTAANNETPAFGPFVSKYVSAELYTDAAAGATGAATAQAQRASKV